MGLRPIPNTNNIAEPFGPSDMYGTDEFFEIQSARKKWLQQQEMLEDAMNYFGVQKNEDAVNDFTGFSNAISNYEKATGRNISKSFNDLSDLLSAYFSPNVVIRDNKFVIQGTEQALNSQVTNDLEEMLSNNFKGQDMTSTQMQDVVESLNEDLRTEIKRSVIENVLGYPEEMYKDYMANVEAIHKPNLSTSNPEIVGYDKDGNKKRKKFNEWVDYYMSEFDATERAWLFAQSMEAVYDNPDDLYLRTPFLVMSMGQPDGKPVVGFTDLERAKAFVNSFVDTQRYELLQFMNLGFKIPAAGSYIINEGMSAVGESLGADINRNTIKFLTEEDYNRKVKDLLESDKPINQYDDREKALLTTLLYSNNYSTLEGLDQNKSLKEIIEASEEARRLLTSGGRVGDLPEDIRNEVIAFFKENGIRIDDTYQLRRVMDNAVGNRLLRLLPSVDVNFKRYNSLAESFNKIDELEAGRDTLIRRYSEGETAIAAQTYSPLGVRAGEIAGGITGGMLRFYLEAWLLKTGTKGLLDVTQISNKIRGMSDAGVRAIADILSEGKPGTIFSGLSRIGNATIPKFLTTKRGAVAFDFLINFLTELPEDYIQNAVDGIMRGETPEEFLTYTLKEAALQAAFSGLETIVGAVRGMQIPKDRAQRIIYDEFVRRAEIVSNDMKNVYTSMRTKTLGVNENGKVTYVDELGNTRTLENVSIIDLSEAAAKLGTLDEGIYIYALKDKYLREKGQASTKGTEDAINNARKKFAEEARKNARKATVVNDVTPTTVAKSETPRANEISLARAEALRKEQAYLDDLRKRSVADSYLGGKKSELISLTLDPTLENYARYKDISYEDTLKGNLEITKVLIDDVKNSGFLTGDGAKDAKEYIERAEREIKSIEDGAKKSIEKLKSQYPGFMSVKIRDFVLRDALDSNRLLPSEEKKALENIFGSPNGNDLLEESITGTPLQEELKGLSFIEKVQKLSDFLYDYSALHPDFALNRIEKAVKSAWPLNTLLGDNPINLIARQKLDIMIKSKDEVDPVKQGYSTFTEVTNKKGYRQFISDHVEKVEDVKPVGEKLAIAIFQPGGPVDRINPLLRDGTLSNEDLVDYVVDYIPDNYRPESRLSRVLGDDLDNSSAAAFYRNVLETVPDQYYFNNTEAIDAMSDDEVIALIKEELRPALEGTHKVKDDVILYRAANSVGNVVNKAAKGGLEFVTGETDKFMDPGGMFVSLSPDVIAGYTAPASNKGTGFYLRLHVPAGTKLFAFGDYGFGYADGGAFIMSPKLDGIVMNVTERRVESKWYPQFEIYVGETLGDSNEIDLSLRNIPLLSQSTLDLARPKNIGKSPYINMGQDMDIKYTNSSDVIFDTTPFEKNDIVLRNASDEIKDNFHSGYAVNGYNTRGDMFVITDAFSSDSDAWMDVGEVIVSNKAIMRQSDIETAKKDAAEYRKRFANMPYAKEIVDGELEKVDWVEVQEYLADLNADVMFRRATEEYGKEGKLALEHERNAFLRGNFKLDNLKTSSATLKKMIELFRSDEKLKLFDDWYDTIMSGELDDGLAAPGVKETAYLIVGLDSEIENQLAYMNKSIYDDNGMLIVPRAVHNVYAEMDNDYDLHFFNDDTSFQDELKARLEEATVSTRDESVRDAYAKVLATLDAPAIRDPNIKSGDEIMREWRTIDKTEFTDAPNSDSAEWESREDSPFEKEEPTTTAETAEPVTAEPARRTRKSTKRMPAENPKPRWETWNTVQELLAAKPLKGNVQDYVNWQVDGRKFMRRLYENNIKPELESRYPSSADRERLVTVYDYIFKAQKINKIPLNKLINTTFSAGDVSYHIDQEDIDFYNTHIEPYMKTLRDASFEARGETPIESTVGYLPHTDYDPMDFTADEAFERGVLFKKFTGSSVTIDDTFNNANLSQDLGARLDIFSSNMLWDATGDGIYIAKYMEELHADGADVSVEEVEKALAERKVLSNKADKSTSVKDFHKKLLSDKEDIDWGEFSNNLQSNAKTLGPTKAINASYGKLYKGREHVTGQLSSKVVPYRTLQVFFDKTKSGDRTLWDWGGYELIQNKGIAMDIIQRCENGENFYDVLINFLTKNRRRSQKSAELIAKKWINSLGRYTAEDGTIDKTVFTLKLANKIEIEGKTIMKKWIATTNINELNKGTLARLDSLLLGDHVIGSMMNSKAVQSALDKAANGVLKARMANLFYGNIKNATLQLSEIARLFINFKIGDSLKTIGRLAADAEFRKKLEFFAEGLGIKQMRAADMDAASELYSALASESKIEGNKLTIGDVSSKGKIKEFFGTIDKIAMLPIDTAERFKNYVILAGCIQEAESLGVSADRAFEFISRKYNRVSLAANKANQLGYADNAAARIAYSLRGYSFREIGLLVDDLNDANIPGKIKYMTKLLGAKMAVWFIFALLGVGYGLNTILGLDPFGLMDEQYTGLDEEDYTDLDRIVDGPIGRLAFGGGFLSLFSEFYFAMRNAYESEMTDLTPEEEVEEARKHEEAGYIGTLGMLRNPVSSVWDIVGGAADALTPGATEGRRLIDMYSLIEEGYQKSMSGNIKYAAPDNALDTTRGWLFGPNATTNAQEYNQTGNPIKGLVDNGLPGFGREFSRELSGEFRQFDPIDKENFSDWFTGGSGDEQQWQSGYYWFLNRRNEIINGYNNTNPYSVESEDDAERAKYEELNELNQSLRRFVEAYQAKNGTIDGNKVQQILNILNTYSYTGGTKEEREAARQEGYNNANDIYAQIGFPQANRYLPPKEGEDESRVFRSPQYQSAVQGIYGLPREAAQQLNDLYENKWKKLSQSYRDRIFDGTLSFDEKEALQKEAIAEIRKDLDPIVSMYGTSILNNDAVDDVLSDVFNGLIPLGDYNVNKYGKRVSLPELTEVDVSDWLRVQYKDYPTGGNITWNSEDVSQVRALQDEGKIAEAKALARVIITRVQNNRTSISRSDLEYLQSLLK